MIMEETGKIFKKEKEMKKGEACSNAGALLWARWVPAARGQRGRKGCPLLELARCSQRAPLSPAHTTTSELELRVSSLPKMRGTGGSAALGTVTWCHLNVPPSSLPCALEAWGPFCKCLVAGYQFYSVGAWVKEELAQEHATRCSPAALGLEEDATGHFTQLEKTLKPK